MKVTVQIIFCCTLRQCDFLFSVWLRTGSKYTYADPKGCRRDSTLILPIQTLLAQSKVMRETHYFWKVVEVLACCLDSPGDTLVGRRGWLTSHYFWLERWDSKFWCVLHWQCEVRRLFILRQSSYFDTALVSGRSFTKAGMSVSVLYLGPMVVLILTFYGNSVLISLVAILAYIPTSNVETSPHQILASIYCFLHSWL